MEYESLKESSQAVKNKLEWEEWLENLPTKRQREAARLIVFSNYSQSDIARELNISRQAVSSHCKKIKKHIERHPDNLPIDID